uniref:Proteasome inhibitor PI31 subunit n=1 Tax=Pavo cristatus TaxID=9049 RepID=A0A8C9EP36_PAVCR
MNQSIPKELEIRLGKQQMMPFPGTGLLHPDVAPAPSFCHLSQGPAENTGSRPGHCRAGKLSDNFSKNSGDTDRERRQRKHRNNPVNGSLQCWFLQDALVCGIHWELIQHGYRCLGAGEQPGPDERKSELLPAGWEANKEVYTLRYKTTDDARELLLKAIVVEDSMILNVMDHASQKVADVTLAVADYINPEHLNDFHKVYKNMEELRTRIVSGIVAPLGVPTEKAKKESQAEKKDPVSPRDYNPLGIPPRHPAGVRAPSWPSPLNPFAVGGQDLDPLGGRSGGMIVDPLRSGFPQPGIDPSAGLPSRLPPGAVPPGARFDPFGPLGAGRAGPDPDHLPPPGYDDMFM